MCSAGLAFKIGLKRRQNVLCVDKAFFLRRYYHWDKKSPLSVTKFIDGKTHIQKFLGRHSSHVSIDIVFNHWNLSSAHNSIRHIRHNTLCRINLSSASAPLFLQHISDILFQKMDTRQLERTIFPTSRRKGNLRYWQHTQFQALGMHARLWRRLVKSINIQIDQKTAEVL